MSGEPKNWASVEENAEVVEVSHEASHVISSAQNVLVEREDMLWISGTLPQHIVIKIDPDHPPIRFVGWMAWQNYLTNPKTVEISSGVVNGCLNTVIVCNGLPGPGKQLWELQEPIPASHTFIKFTVTATFGATSTYMNRVYLYDQHPGEGFTAPSNDNSMVDDQLPTSPLKMTTMLRELDQEIRMLHPLRNFSPQRSASTGLDTSQQQLPAPPLHYGSHNASSSSIPQQPRELNSSTHYAARSPPQRPSTSGGYSNSGAGDDRLAQLERSMTQLVQLVSDQRHEMNEMRRLLLNNAQQTTLPQPPLGSGAQEGVGARRPSPQRNGSRSASAASLGGMPFPESALRHYVEEVMAPKLDKHRARIESKVMQRVEDAIRDIETDVRQIVDDRVRRYLYDIAMDREHPYHTHFRESLPTSHLPASSRKVTSSSTSRRRHEDPYYDREATRTSSTRRKETALNRSPQKENVSASSDYRQEYVTTSSKKHRGPPQDPHVAYPDEQRYRPQSSQY